jgi:hypothetical protein
MLFLLKFFSCCALAGVVAIAVPHLASGWFAAIAVAGFAGGLLNNMGTKHDRRREF